MAMMFRYTFARADVSDRIEAAVRRTLKEGRRSADIAAAGVPWLGTREMGDAVVGALAGAP
jgi:3-isopropylmalate dehydrogenase